MPSRGAADLRGVARDLKRAGSPGRGLSRRLRRNITTAVQPMKQQAQANAHAIPSKGRGLTGLRSAISDATQLRITPAGRTTNVRLQVNPSRMPAGQQSLPLLMEGERPWRHPVYGTGTWVSQDAHPYFARAVAQHLPGVQAGVIRAVNETAAELSRG